MAKSPSALANHSVVSRLIQDNTPVDDVAHKIVAKGNALCDLLWALHKQIAREWWARLHADVDALVDAATLEGHDDHQVDIGLWGCGAVRVGPEENDALRMKHVNKTSQPNAKVGKTAGRILLQWDRFLI